MVVVGVCVRQIVHEAATELLAFPNITVLPSSASHAYLQVSAKQVAVASSDEVLTQLQAASNNRSTSATLRNTDSSRSHAFYRVTIYCEEPITQGACTWNWNSPDCCVGGCATKGLCSFTLYIALHST